MAEQLVDVFDVRVQFPIDLRTVKADLNARNAIEPLQRYEGLPVWVVSEQKLYRLIGGITNDDWVDQTPNGGIQTVTVSSSTPTGGNPGDIHFKTVSGGFEVWFNNLGTWGSVGTVPTGSSTPTLQSVTDEGNSTDNTIQVSGSDNTDGGIDSVAMSYLPNNGRIALITSGEQRATLYLTNGTAALWSGLTGPRLIVGTSGGGTRFQNESGVFVTVKGADAVSDDDFVTKRQLDSSSSPTRTPDPSLSFSTTSADMESSHPTAAIGDIFYNVDGTEIYVATKIATGIWQIQQSGT